MSKVGPYITIRQKPTFRVIAFSAFTSLVIFLSWLIWFNLKPALKTYATATETIPTGSFIVNMGIVPQTIANGLIPYGMVYDFITNYSVPVKWVIEPTKVKDGTDFTYNSVNYNGGTFIISSDYINSTVTTRISYWKTKGVQGVYTTAAIAVPVYATLTNFPRIIIDTISNNQNIIINYFTNAGIPTTAYQKGSPSLLTNCHDLWVNPHGDPTWATHGSLYNFVTVAKSCIWSECHAVSVLEGVTNPSSPYQQLNYLTVNGLKCYNNNNCGSNITQSHSGNPTSPYTYNYPSDPVMQFIGTIDGSTSNGSEDWYIPQTTGGWRSTTKRLVTTSDGVSPYEGVLLAYGQGYADSTNGYVMYEAGHDLTTGNATSSVPAQRAFLNYVLLAGKVKQISISSYSIPASMQPNEKYSVSVSASGGSPGYTYAWTSSIGGTFGNAAAASTTFTVPNVTPPISGYLTATVTDACGRTNFISIPFTITTSAPLPITLVSFSANEINGGVKINWTTGSEINNEFFTVARSADGFNYATIATLKGAGNSTSPINYSADDDSPLSGLTYYRLSQTDYDGKTETFPPVTLRMRDASNSGAFIRPFSTIFDDHITFEYRIQTPGNVEFFILNLAGRVVKSETAYASSGTNILEVNYLSFLPKGIYIILMKEEDVSLCSVKVIKI